MCTKNASVCDSCLQSRKRVRAEKLGEKEDVHTYIHTYIRMYIHTYIHRVLVCTSICTHTHTHTWKRCTSTWQTSECSPENACCGHLSAWMHAYICVWYTCMCDCASDMACPTVLYVCMHMYTYTHTPNILKEMTYIRHGMLTYTYCVCMCVCVCVCARVCY